MEKNLPILINELSVATIEQNFEEMQTRSQKAAAALATIQEIKTDEEDEKAEKILVKVRTTFTYIESMRKAITGPLDDMKKVLMEPEKLISNTVSGNEYERVKLLRDAYANAKFKEEQVRQAEIEARRIVEQQRVLVRSIFKTNYTEGIVKTNMTLNNKLAEAFQTTTIETLETLKKRLSLGAKLLKGVYDSWFDPTAIQSSLPFIEVKNISEELKKELTYEKAEEEYGKLSKATMDSWMDRIPELEASLQAGVEAAEESRRKLAEQMKKEEEERNNAALKVAQEKAESEAKAAQLQTEFRSQMELQAGAIEMKGNIKKRAVIEADTQDFVAIISELFFNVFIHPKYAGIIKKDKKGQPQFNADGTPIYVDWLQGLLDFYATNCEEEIPGIKIIEEVKTTQRAK